MEYIRQIALFIIIVDIFNMIITNDSYRKYLNLFAGIVLVLLVIHPLDRFINTEDLSYSIEKIFKEENIIEMDKSLSDIDGNISESSLRIYEQEIGGEIKRYLLGKELEVREVKVELKIEEDAIVYSTICIEMDNFGKNRSEISTEQKYIESLITEKYSVQADVIEIR